MSATPTLGLVLAGGLARRMGGGDKPFTRIGGATILSRVLERIEPQCTRVVLNANGDPARFADTGLPVIADDVPDFAGPLAGILAGLDWAAAHAPEVAYVASVPGDCPFLPRDLVARLHQALRPLGRMAASGGWRVAGRAPRRPPACVDPRRLAQDRALDRAARRRTGGLADRAGRSVLQRQHAGGCHRGGASCGAISRHLNR